MHKIYKLCKIQGINGNVSMKFGSSIFAIMTVIPCITLYVNDAHADDCEHPGWYRWAKSKTATDWCMPCPKGCYCPGAADDYDAVIGGDKFITCKSGLTKYGIRECGTGWTTKVDNSLMHGQTYEQGAMSESDCFFNATDTGNKMKYNNSKKCSPGQYLTAGKENCQSCKSGHICPGGKPKSGQKNLACLAYDTWNSQWNMKDLYTLWVNPAHDEGIYKCPSGKIANADHSKCVDKNNSSNNNDNNKPSQKINCKAGTYLPMGGKSINDCKSCLDGYYCPGGTFEIKSIDQGLKSCAYDQKPNTNRTACISARTHCDKGYFLPANSSICEKCVSSDYVCFGGDFIQNQNTNQGQSKCNSYQIPNDDKTYCIDKSSVNTYCNAGQYLPANSTKCERCPSTKHYCIGGEFKYESFDQGIYDCPMSSVANDRRDSCVLTLSQDFMKYGPNGSNVSIDEQCWTKKTDTAYKNCIFNTTVSHSKSHFATKIPPITTPLLNNLQNNRSVPEILLKEKPVRKEIIKIEKGSLEQALIDSAKK